MRLSRSHAGPRLFRCKGIHLRKWWKNWRDQERRLKIPASLPVRQACPRSTGPSRPESCQEGEDDRTHETIRSVCDISRKVIRVYNYMIVLYLYGLYTRCD